MITNAIYQVTLEISIEFCHLALGIRTRFSEIDSRFRIEADREMVGSLAGVPGRAITHRTPVPNAKHGRAVVPDFAGAFSADEALDRQSIPRGIA